MNLHNNIIFLKWLFNKKKNILDESTFNLLTYAYIEDPYCFFRILLYFANTRSTTEHEVTYKALLHYLSIIQPDMLFANIELITNIGYKKDILYFNKSMFEKLQKWVKHKSYTDNFYYELLTNGKLLNEHKKVIKYKKSKEKNNKWEFLLNNILDDARYNGILITKADIEQ